MHVCAGYDKGRPKQALPEAVAVKESGKVSNNTRVRRKGKLTGLDHQSGSDYRSSWPLKNILRQFNSQSVYR
jgi:hypothetical protein